MAYGRLEEYPMMKDNKWLYNCPDDMYISTGYEAYEDLFKEYDGKSAEIKAMTEEEKQNHVDRIYDVYRSVNIFPIKYYSQSAMEDEIINFIKFEGNVYDGKVLKNRCNRLLNLLKYTHPNQHNIVRADSDSILYRFYDEKQLKIAIKGSLQTNSNCRPHGVYNFMTLINSTPTNFKPQTYRELIERYTPKNGLVFDTSAGLGGRIAGTLCSQKNLSYIGVDPWVETQENNARVGDLIEKITGRKNSYRLFTVGSENFKLSQEGIADFSATSPPYFNCELYSTDTTQCYNRFDELNRWLRYFWLPTLSNIYHTLKPGAFFVVNIANFLNKAVSKEVQYIDITKKLAQQVGFEYIRQSDMLLTTRIGSGNEGSIKGKGRLLGTTKAEPLIVFRKPLDMHNLGNNVKIDVEY